MTLDKNKPLRLSNGRDAIAGICVNCYYIEVHTTPVAGWGKCSQLI